MATDPPESEHRFADENALPQIDGADLELLRCYRLTEVLKREIEARDSKLARLGEAAKKREDELCRELGRQSAYLAEEIKRLERELQDQSAQAAECISKLRAEIEHLKITRFEARRENYSIKTSLSWRLTWPLRALRDAGTVVIRRAHRQFPLLASWRSPSASPANFSPPPCLGAEQQPEVDRESIEGFVEGLLSLSRNKETVLLVTHEISRTGAPILVLNLAGCLRPRYNVIILALRDGALENEFLAGSDLLIGPLSEKQRSSHFLTALFREMAARTPLKFAIVNSIGSGITLSALWENDIATVHLIHEFSSYIRPRGQFRSSAFYSSERIFPAEIVRESARQELPERASFGLVLPQGICFPPSRPEPGERERIHFDLRPAGWPAGTVVILGAGAVTLRKGVDLFIACARRVAEMAPKTKFRFVWIGEGLEREPDAKYSLYLADQIQRSGLNGIAVILKAVPDMEGAYLESDVLFLSSRLDPLPLVSLDAIRHAKPVVCFKAATGIAEYLTQDPLAAFGIVPFLDIEAAAGRIYRLIEDAELRLQAGQASKRLSGQFRLDRYVEELDRIGQRCAIKKRQEKTDRLIIAQSSLFDTGFFLSPLEPPVSQDPVRHYLSAYSTGIRSRKAFPGFHPGIYEERNELRGRDPLAHYLVAGKPAGPWKFDVIRAASEAEGGGQSLRVGLHLHLYHYEMSEEIFEQLRGISSRTDLLISVASEPAAEAVGHTFSKYSQGAVQVRVFQNRGRDIGPFLTGFGELIIQDYDIVGHVHAKKSAGKDTNGDSRSPAFFKSISLWRRFLYANLLGGRRAMADAIIQRLSRDETLGLVFPDDPHILGWGKNLPYAVSLAQRLGVSEPLPRNTFNFPVGSMFWARTAALRPLFELGLSWDDYPEEPVPYDGSLLHAIERILPFVAESAGFRSAVTHVSGVTR